VLLVGATWSLDGAVPFLGLPVLVVCCGVAALAWRQFVGGKVVRATAFAVVASALLALGVFGLGQTALRSLKLSPRLAEAAERLACEDPQVATLGYREPSLVFLVGTDLRMLQTGEEAARYLAEGGCRMVFVEGRFQEAFEAEAARLGSRPALSTRVSGFNINNGRRLDISAYTAGDPGPR
jgi:hypothetical protein